MGKLAGSRGGSTRPANKTRPTSRRTVGRLAGAAVAFGGLAAVGSVASPAPAGAYTFIGTGCHFDANKGEVLLNQWSNYDSDGEVGYATYIAAARWNSQAGSEAPYIRLYYPSASGPPGDFGTYIYGNAESVNSGYTSTWGPPSFAAPPCGSTSWAWYPNQWLNYDKMAARAWLGLRETNFGTAGHEMGHALGLNHNEGNPSTCSPMFLMDAHVDHASNCGVNGPTSDEIAGVNKIYN